MAYNVSSYVKRKGDKLIELKQERDKLRLIMAGFSLILMVAVYIIMGKADYYVDTIISYISGSSSNSFITSFLDIIILVSVLASGIGIAISKHRHSKTKKDYDKLRQDMTQMLIRTRICDCKSDSGCDCLKQFLDKMDEYDVDIIVTD
jgi:hypothetical protein